MEKLVENSVVKFEELDDHRVIKFEKIDGCYEDNGVWERNTMPQNSESELSGKSEQDDSQNVKMEEIDIDEEEIIDEKPFLGINEKPHVEATTTKGGSPLFASQTELSIKAEQNIKLEDVYTISYDEQIISYEKPLEEDPKAMISTVNNNRCENDSQNVKMEEIDIDEEEIIDEKPFLGINEKPHEEATTTKGGSPLFASQSELSIKAEQNIKLEDVYTISYEEQIISYEKPLEEDPKAMISTDDNNRCEELTQKIRNTNQTTKISEVTSSPNSNPDADKYWCRICDFVTKYKQCFKKHLEIVHLGKKSAKCSFCDYAAGDKETLKKHVDAVHLKLKPFKCEKCEYSSYHKRNVVRHVITVHTADKSSLNTFPCHLCEYATSGRSILLNHINGVHLRKYKEKCHFCNFSAVLRKDVDIHINSVHLKLKKFECHLCNYAGSRKAHLKSHIELIHLKNKYRCHLCKYATSQIGELNNHKEKIHSNCKKLSCDSCDYVSYIKSELEDHINSIHLNLQKKHKCNLCDYSAYHDEELKSHRNSIHSNLNILNCHLCDYGSHNKYILKSHINSVHLKINQYRCDSCSFATSYKQSLARHKNKHNN